ncbi:MAG TPA: DUF362 domain-containing protein [Nitrospirae bacterium]|nr:benzoyl-CoA oxygenase component A [bacterium BMS3Abin10]GBE39785.1 benzoyl-CoA oxygenase component A [bacterium BMS3Bbin08]HDH49897.1 DUF362 domain-containing protein [Nitrospirota bacterium]HDK17117.1 DUF362 domain-containing protein [Nitrospirota bacterium]HDK81462.1 DUF362 domain-containing protein [Nitrospirota bacterium]
MPEVVLERASYDYDDLKKRFFRIMDSIGGDRIKNNSRVVIKPNLLAPAPPEKAILTHPLVVRAAVEYVLKKGARPQVSDSNAVGSFAKILKESGIREALKGLDVECSEFRTSEHVDLGKPFRKIEIAKEALNADVLINLPKLKTHTQMLLTLGVKNLFGCIVGMKKPEWHLRTGVDRKMFATLLVQICGALKPGFTVLDGILAMEGQGPGKGGTPRELGVLMGSRDPFSMDTVVCKMLGIRPDSLLTNKVAKELGLANGTVSVKGDMPEIKNFRFPEITPVVFGPKSLHRLMRKHLVQRPVSEADLCKMCGECWEYCPAKAISKDKKKERVRFDYEKCIRCYCCIEVCPHGALSAKETFPGKFIRRVVKKDG